MSTQSGIEATPELSEAFNQAQQAPDTRALVIDIQEEKLVCSKTIAKSRSESSPAEDFELLLENLKDSHPCYAAFKLEQNTQWLLVTWVPDDRPVKQKMLVASTQATLIKQLGTANFTDQLFASDADDLCADGWKRHLKHRQAKAPLSEKEQEAKLAKDLEGLRTEGTSTRNADMHASIKGMPWSDEAQAAVTSFASSETKVLYLSLDIPNETIILRAQGDTLQLPASEPAYAFYRTSSGSIVFIYCCPSGSPVKSRMLFSTNFLGIYNKAQALGLSIAKKMESSEPSEMTESFVEAELDESVKPPTDIKKEATSGFARPKRPGRR